MAVKPRHAGLAAEVCNAKYAAIYPRRHAHVVPGRPICHAQQRDIAEDAGHVLLRVVVDQHGLAHGDLHVGDWQPIARLVEHVVIRRQPDGRLVSRRVGVFCPQERHGRHIEVGHGPAIERHAAFCRNAASDPERRVQRSVGVHLDHHFGARQHVGARHHRVCRCVQITLGHRLWHRLRAPFDPDGIHFLRASIERRKYRRHRGRHAVVGHHEHPQQRVLSRHQRYGEVVRLYGLSEVGAHPGRTRFERTRQRVGPSRLFGPTSDLDVVRPGTQTPYYREVAKRPVIACERALRVVQLAIHNAVAFRSNGQGTASHEFDPEPILVQVAFELSLRPFADRYARCARSIVSVVVRAPGHARVRNPLQPVLEHSSPRQA